MAGIIGMGANNRRTATDAFDMSANMQKRRERANERLEQQEKSRQTSAVATGASIGTTISPGWGTIIGAGVGFLANELF